MSRFEIGPHVVEWSRSERGFWYEVYEGPGCIARGWSIFPPQELDTVATIERLLGDIRPDPPESEGESEVDG